jgi:hypothetical protein
MNSKVAHQHHSELTKWLMKKGLCLGDFAQKIGIKYMTASAWLYGGHIPCREHCARIKAAGFEDCPLLKWRQESVDRRLAKLI